jgi:hypothetical protein
LKALEVSALKAYKFLDSFFGLKSLREKRLKISTLQDLNDPFELLPFDVSNRLHRSALRTTLGGLAACRGILCFSADWRDPVIWAHYSDKHRGLCLEFRLPDELCHEINYVSKRLLFPTAPVLGDATALLFTKYINWKYEKEIRVWAALNEKADGLYFSNFGDDLKLTKVIAGARCSIPEHKIIEALGELVRDVTVIKARAGFKQFEVVKDKRGFSKEHS